ncbi:TetR-like C-terminal domain-containing protein [Streptomyces europaeiscabiei]|uniref:TetR-like C-terminal domain-containing protein n=1 Tax=Streptomyces europaeiscabiei TaxID=146819 RepID=UPI0029A3CB2D|nr:TetR-like C-terminal domain-containing protein [Streptomyces europaeiscabiei]MDX3696514.1 TetR-like C-terminal domain-containing protein [Streptomyces europaeiscabiei]
MPSRPAPSHRRGAAVRQAVLEATTELLAAEGLEGARIADIAARAHVHETSVYRRWGTRTNLILEALSHRLDTELPCPDTGSTHEDLTLFFTALAAFLATPTGRALARIALAPSDDVTQSEELRQKFWTARLDRAGLLLQRGIARGDLPEHADPEFLLEALAGPLHLRILQRDQPAGHAYVRRLVDLILTGARPTPTNSGPGPNP